MPVSTSVASTYSTIEMTSDQMIALGMCRRASRDSSAAVLIASYPKTAKKTVAAPVIAPPTPNGKNGE